MLDTYQIPSLMSKLTLKCHTLDFVEWLRKVFRHRREGKRICSCPFLVPSVQPLLSIPESPAPFSVLSEGQSETQVLYILQDLEGTEMLTSCF